MGGIFSAPAPKRRKRKTTKRKTTTKKKDKGSKYKHVDHGHRTKKTLEQCKKKKSKKGRKRS